MKTAEKFKQLQIKDNLDLSVCGIHPGKTTSDYFCTPKGATVIGWAGVDGIHYCVIDGFDEMVFAVSPMNTPGDYVHPLAKDFRDFLRLLLACGDAAALEQAHFWDREQFERFFAENPATDEQRAVLAKIRVGSDETVGCDEEGGCGAEGELTPMEDPFSYLKAVQAEFDYRKLRFKPDYEEWAPEEPKVPTAPEWKVCFGAGFFATKGYGRAGKEIRIDKQFCWDNSNWFIPAIYLCSEGLVMDLCVEATAESIQAFIDKWNLNEEDEESFFEEDRMLAEHEHPLNVDVRAKMAINGRKLRMSRGSGLTWIPKQCLPEGERTNREAGWIAEHYGLDLNKGYGFHRMSFPWATKNKPVLKSMELTLEASPVSLPGIRMKGLKAGDLVRFMHPLTKVEHTLTVQSVEADEVAERSLGNLQFAFPGHYTRMTYTLLPDISDKNISLRDCNQSDQPRQRKDLELADKQRAGDFAASIGIIGGADGPTAIFLASPVKQSDAPVTGWHMACSSFHFEPVEDVEWRVEFREKLREDVCIEMIV